MPDINKSDDIIIRISENEYQNRKFIDVRQFYKDSEGEFRPTKKGVTFSLDLLEDVIKGLRKFGEKWKIPINENHLFPDG